MVLRPVRPDDRPALRAIGEQPEVAAWWGTLEDGFPPSDEPETTRFAVLVEGELVGLVQFGEETEPDQRHAWIDVFIDAAHHGHGIETHALATLLRHLVDERGHNRPAVANTAAVRASEKAGFTLSA